MSVTAHQTVTSPLSSRRVLGGVGRLATYLLLVAGNMLFVIPFLWMVRTSLMEPSNIYLFPPQVIPDPIRLQNYPEMWETGPFLSWVRNSITITVISVIGDTLASTAAAYGFARTRFPGRNALFYFVLATMMIPYQVVLIPRYLLFRELGWLNSMYPLIVPNLFGSAFFIFILRQFFMSLPTELDDAAEIDGANLMTILWRIDHAARRAGDCDSGSVLLHQPLERLHPAAHIPAVPESITLAVGIRWFTGRHGTEFHLLMAISVVALLPIIITFFFAQKQFIRGIALTGIKG